jgi:hypothetical protein
MKTCSKPLKVSCHSTQVLRPNRRGLAPVVDYMLYCVMAVKVHDSRPAQLRCAVLAAAAAALLVLAGGPLPAAAQGATINVVPSYHIVLRGTASRVANPTNYKALAYQRVSGAW